MITIEIALITMIVAIGLYATISDFITGLIKNKVLGVALILGIILDSCYYALYCQDLFRSFIINVAVLFVVAIVLFITHIWAGGDSKLLITIGVLYPARWYYIFDPIPYSLLLIIIFSFILGYLYLLADTAGNLFNKKKPVSWKSVGQNLKKYIMQYAFTMIYVVAITLIYNYFIQPTFNVNSRLITVLLIAFAMIINSVTLLKNRALIIATLAFDVLMSIISRTIPISTNWKTYVFILIAVILRMVMSNYNYKEIPAKEIRRGMILSIPSSILLIQTRIDGMPPISTEGLQSRLSESEANKIRSWEQKMPGQQTLVIIKKIPFAVFIFLGTVILVVLKGVSL